MTTPGTPEPGSVFPGKGLGKLSFGMSPTQVDALSEVYGADTEAAFDKLAISVAGFCVTGPACGVCPLVEADERFQERTVIPRPEPYLPEGERDRFITYRLLG